MLKRILAVISALSILVISAGTVYADGVSAEPAEKGYVKVAQRDGLTLFADMESGYFYLQDKDNNLIYSVPKDMEQDSVTTGITRMLINSQLRVQYIACDGGVYVGNETATPSSQGSLYANGVKVLNIDNGIRVEYTFPAIEAMIPVEYTLENGGFEAAIITKDITEKKNFVITALELLPMFGAANNKASGSLFVPDGYGALINFNNGTQSNIYKSAVYGEEIAVRNDMQKTNTEKVRMPVFATIYDNLTLMGIITKGESQSSIMAIGANDNCGYNAVSSVLNYRKIAFDTMLSNNANIEQSITRVSKKYSEKEYRVRYYVLSGNKGGYVGAAEKYREYLINEKGLKAQSSEPKFNIDVYGATEQKGNFLGISYRKSLALTDYDEVMKIADAAQKLGIDNISFRLLGWSKDGIQNYKILKKVKFSSALGGKSDFKKLLKSTEDQKIPLVLDADILSFRKGGKSNNTSTLFNKKAFKYTYMRSVYAIDLRFAPSRLLTPLKIADNSKKLIKSFVKNNIENVSLSSLTNLIYSDFGEKHSVNRTVAQQYVEKALKSFKSKGINVYGDGANAYALPYLSKIYSAPQSNSAYKMFDKEVPFYQIVLHGIMPLTTTPVQSELDSNMALLKAVETGSELLYNAIYKQSDKLSLTTGENLYSAYYKNWLDEASDYYGKYYLLLSKVHDKTITDHRELQKNVMKTVFSDGTSVVVNYSDSDVKIGGQTVKALSFCELS